MKKIVIISVVSGISFLLIYLLGKNLLVALLISLFLLALMLIIFREPKVAKHYDVVSQYSPNDDIKLGQVYLSRIRAYILALGDDPIVPDLKELTICCENIFKSVEQQGRNFGVLKDITKSYLPSLIKVLDQYKETLEYNISGSQARKYVDETKKFVKEISSGFSAILSQVHSLDIMDAEAERDTLKTLMTQYKSDGVLNLESEKREV